MIRIGLNFFFWNQMMIDLLEWIIMIVWLVATTAAVVGIILTSISLSMISPKETFLIVAECGLIIVFVQLLASIFYIKKLDIIYPISIVVSCVPCIASLFIWRKPRTRGFIKEMVDAIWGLILAICILQVLLSLLNTVGVLKYYKSHRLEWKHFFWVDWSSDNVLYGSP